MTSKTIVALLLFALGSLTAYAEVQDKTATIAKTTIHYKVILPMNYDAAKAYPGILAFPGGSQTMNIVENMVKRNYQAQAEARGYIVVMPAAPDGVLFFEGSEKIFPEFLVKLLKDYKIQGNKFHIAGVSNGGISAFHVAVRNPEYFLSLTGFPGYLIDANSERVAALGKLCGGIYMHVGELDSGWREDMEEQAKLLRSKGYKVRISVEKGEQHIIRALQDAGSARLFNQFDEARQACGK